MMPIGEDRAELEFNAVGAQIVPNLASQPVQQCLLREVCSE